MEALRSMKIALTSVFVHDPISAHRFYTEVLGFATRLLMPEANLAIVVSPEEPDGTGLLLEPNENPIASTYQKAIYELGMPVIVFGVDDVQKEYERLLQHGVVFRTPPTPNPVGVEAVLEDTCGNLVQLFQAKQ
jgi:predicted enzyme related to lactoylglutathione lyase